MYPNAQCGYSSQQVEYYMFIHFMQTILVHAVHLLVLAVPGREKIALRL